LRVSAAPARRRTEKALRESVNQGDSLNVAGAQRATTLSPAPIFRPMESILTTAPVLVVVANGELRQLVGWILCEMELPALLVASWREAVASVTEPPSCIVADLDDVGDKTAGVEALSTGWGGSPPLVVLSRSADIESRAAKANQCRRADGRYRPCSGDRLGWTERFRPLELSSRPSQNHGGYLGSQFPSTSKIIARS
jgi:hypothetical protein